VWLVCCVQCAVWIIVLILTRVVFAPCIADVLIHIAVMSSSTIVVAWAGTAQKGTAAVGRISGGEISFSYALEFNTFGGTEQLGAFVVV